MEQISCPACHKKIDDDSIFCKWCGKRIAKKADGKAVKTRGNGMGTVYYSQQSKWCCEATQYHEGVRIGRKVKKGFKTKREAAAYLPQLFVAMTAPAEKTWTVAQLFAEVQKTAKWQAISAEKRGHYMTQWRRMDAIHNRNITTVRYWELQELIDSLPGNFYPKREAKTVLSKIWEMAIKQEAIDASQNRVPYIDLPSKTLSKKDARTPEEIRAMWQDWEQGGHQIAAYALIMAYTGMRYGEIATQQVSKIDFERRVMIGGIKTEAGINREIPLRREIIPVIQAVLPAAKYGLLACPETVFYPEWHAMCERLGIRDLPPHCQRHTYVTRLQEVQPALSPAVIKACVGHAYTDVTGEYTHISLDKKIEAVDMAAFV